MSIRVDPARIDERLGGRDFVYVLTVRDGGVHAVAHRYEVDGPVVSVYDAYNGGVGIAEVAYERLDDLLAAVAEQIDCCPCEDGCPECVQAPNCGDNNMPLDKAGALLLARRLVGE